MKELKINEKFIALVPNQWKDLNALHIKKICKLAFSSPTDSLLRVQLFLLITGMRLLQNGSVYTRGESHYWMRCPKTGSVLISLSQIMFITRCFNFLFTNQNGQTFIESQITQNHFPALRNKWGRKLYGPDSALFSLTWEEFIRAETIYETLQRNPETKQENRLMAVLYRPAGKNPNKADKRIGFDDHRLDKMARHTARLAPWQKVFIRLLYDGCRAFIITRYPHAFGSGGSEEELAKPKPQIQKFMELSAALTQNDPTKAEDLRKALLWDVLPTLEQMGKEAKLFKQKTAKTKY